MARFVPGRNNGETPELDLAQQKSWQNYLTTVLRMNTVLNRQLTDEHQLSLADVHLLDLLNNAPDGSVQMGELADALPSLPSRLTRHVRRLENQGLVLRSVSPRDRRRVVATITEAGRISVEQAMVTYANAVRTHFLGPLTRPQIAAMANTCHQIGNGLKQSPPSAALKL